jgi:hypothetical protein
MTFNSQSIIHDIRKELDKLINFVSGEQAQTATADHMERTLFREMLKLGAKLLLLFSSYALRNVHTSQCKWKTVKNCLIIAKRSETICPSLERYRSGGHTSTKKDHKGAAHWMPS